MNLKTTVKALPFVGAALLLLSSTACARAVVPLHPVAVQAHYERTRVLGCIDDGAPEGFCQLVAEVAVEMNKLAGCELWQPGVGKSPKFTTLVTASPEVVEKQIAKDSRDLRLGQTSMYKDGMALVVINMRLCNARGVNLRDVVRHEMTHAHGFDHAPPSADSVMRPIVSEDHLPGFRPIDVKAMRGLCAKPSL